MKACLFLSACLLFVGCGRQEEAQREVLGKLEALKTELASKQSEPVRWAFASKREIESAISQWSSKQAEEAKRVEGLPADVEEKIRAYEALQSELTRKRFEAMRTGYPPRMGAYDSVITNSDYVALSNKVVEARAPIANILERRSQAFAKFREQYAVEKLVAEYAKDRFELVVDSSDMQFSRSSVLYRKSSEVLDITDGVIKLLNEKTKQ
mgnify:FL=1